jgi:hypothetical protein
VFLFSAEFIVTLELFKIDRPRKFAEIAGAADPGFWRGRVLRVLKRRNHQITRTLIEVLKVPYPYTCM